MICNQCGHDNSADVRKVLESVSNLVARQLQPYFPLTLKVDAKNLRPGDTINLPPICHDGRALPPQVPLNRLTHDVLLEDVTCFLADEVYRERYLCGAIRNIIDTVIGQANGAKTAVLGAARFGAFVESVLPLEGTGALGGRSSHAGVIVQAIMTYKPEKLQAFLTFVILYGCA